MSEQASREGVVTPQQLQQWRSHIGRIRRQQDVIDAQVMQRFAVATGQSPSSAANPPLLAHWAFFLEACERGRLGEDGHPLRGDFLPPVSLRRRMFGAADIHFERSLRAAQPAQCVTVIDDVSSKRGQAGDLVFVELHREISQAGQVCIRERQTIIYREPTDAVASPPGRCADEPRDAADWLPSTVELFRFSAVTFNAHRIHYDLPYAQGVEGYPALVVQGPLIAARLLVFAAKARGLAVRSFSFKSSAPVFVGQSLRFGAGPEAGSYRATRGDGVTAMSAQVVFE